MVNRKGFTLIELLVVIGILAVLLAITLIAVNPAEQLQRSDDTKRQSDVTQILNALNQYMVDNNGALPAGAGVPEQLPDGSVAPAAVADTAADICALLVPQYIAALPQDPASNSGVDITDCTAAYDSGYEVIQDEGRVTVSAPDANDPNGIQATR